MTFLHFAGEIINAAYIVTLMPGKDYIKIELISGRILEEKFFDETPAGYPASVNVERALSRIKREMRP